MPHHSSDLLSQVDQPLQVLCDVECDKEFILCEFNRDADSYSVLCLIIGMLEMVASGATEIARLRRISHGQKTSSLSIFWQIPQYVLVGASEVFMYVGQLESFNEQASDGIKSFGSSLCMIQFLLVTM